MNKNTIHNFNLLIKNSTSVQSSEELTKTIIKELAEVSKEINGQKDIVQLWQEQNALNTVMNNTLDSAEEGAFDTNAAIKTDSSFSTTSSAPSKFNASIGGGVADTTERTTTSSFTSANTTSPISEAENGIMNTSTNQIYKSIDTNQMLILPQTSNSEPSVELVKAEIKKKLYEAIQAEDNEGVEYWRRISKAFENEALPKDFYHKKGEDRFTRMYFGLQKGHLTGIPEVELNNLNWTIISDLMISRLSDLLKETEEPRLISYYERTIKEIRDPEVNIEKLFSEHDELFLLLKSFFPNLPNKISIQTQKTVYPNLSPQKIYPDLGVESIYYIWSKTLLNEIEIKYAEGEKGSDWKGRYPVLKEGQWYDYDRIKNADKKGSTFWNASIYNTMNAQHYLYNTIAQRHAYYKFVDAYLKTKGIISEWFDAAARVTMGSIESAIQGEIALGSAEMMNLWFLSDNSDDFLKGGNKYLFAENMNNVKLLLEGKGRLSGEFIDAKGNKQSFKNLSKQELDFKLVEFEQTMVQDYINSSFKDLDINVMKKSLSEVGVTGNDELDEIVAEINENFTLWMAPDITQDIMKKYFTTNGKITFNFAKYDDRVKLGQVMVKELYYLKLSDTFKARSIDKILKNPRSYSSRTRDYFIIDQKNAIKEEEKHLKEYKILEKLKRVTENLVKRSYRLNELLLVGSDIADAVVEEISKSLAIIKIVIESSLKNIEKDVSNTGYAIEEIVYDDLKVIYDTIKKEFEETKKNKTENKGYADLIKKLYDDMVGINAISEKLKTNLKKEANRAINTIKTEVDQLPEKIVVGSLIKTAERIYPGVSKLADSRREILIRGNYETAVAILLYEFATGKGPEIRNFDYQEHKFAQALLKGRMIEEIMEETLKLLRQTSYDFENKPDSKDLKVDLEFSPTPKYLVESLDKHMDSNLAQIFVGGAFALVRIKNKKLEGYVYNQTGRESLILHIADDINRENVKGKREKELSTIIQRIYFTFELP